ILTNGSVGVEWKGIGVVGGEGAPSPNQSLYVDRTNRRPAVSLRIAEHREQEQAEQRHHCAHGHEVRPRESPCVSRSWTTHAEQIFSSHLACKNAFLWQESVLNENWIVLAPIRFSFGDSGLGPRRACVLGARTSAARIGSHPA